MIDRNDPDHSGMITTYTGLRFDPTEVTEEDIRIEDIAHALSLICRGNGQVRTFFSVGQHCILCAREALLRGESRRVALACLLHDAAECYLSDVPRPFKVHLPEYAVFEDRIMEKIYTRYLGSLLTAEEKRKIREIDDAMLYFDLKELLRSPAGDRPDIHVVPDYTFVPFDTVEKEYLRFFKELLEIT